MRYSASKYSVILKTGLGVQGHWKWHRSIDHNYTTFCWSAIVNIASTFWVIWHRMISWPWNLSKVIQNDTTRKLGYGFLFAFRSNYGSILHHLRDKARYRSTIVILPPCICRPVRGGRRRNIAIPFGTGKLEWRGYPTVKKMWGYV